jgi:hypothetical protein
MRRDHEQVVDEAAAGHVGEEFQAYRELLKLAEEVRPWASVDPRHSNDDLERFEAKFHPFVDRHRLSPGDVCWDRFDWRKYFARKVEQLADR